MQLSEGVPSNEGGKRGFPLRRCYFTAINLSSAKMVAYRHSHDAYHNYSKQEI